MNHGTRFLGGLDVSRETFTKLSNLVALIEKWTKSINLIANSSVSELWARHIEDSAQLFSYAPQGWERWTDIGSGGGLPGLVIAIVDQKKRPITLIESDQRKCLFLNTARRELDLNINVINARIEKAGTSQADVLSARALAPLDKLLGFSEGLLKPNGLALFPKGERFQTEIDLARLEWDFELRTHPSRTHPDAKILEISRITRREC